MRVSLTAPHAGLCALALSTGVVRVPLLAPKALTDGITWDWLPPVDGLHTFVVFPAQVDTILQDPFLGLLIFKAYYDFSDIGASFFVQKSSNPGNFELISFF